MVKRKTRKYWEKSYNEMSSVACGQLVIEDKERAKKIRRRIEDRLRKDEVATKVVALLLNVKLDD